jgi:hypothetical protein
MKHVLLGVGLIFSLSFVACSSSSTSGVDDEGAPGTGNPNAPGSPTAGDDPTIGTPENPTNAGDGSLFWAKRFGANGHYSEGVDVAFAPNGDVVMASTHDNVLPDFGAGPQPLTGRAAVSRFSARGEHKWTFSLPLQGNCEPGSRCSLTSSDAQAVAVDRSGRVALAARVGEEGDDCGPTIVCTKLTVVVLLSSGAEQWRKVITASTGGDAHVGKLGFDGAGNLYVTGDAYGANWDFGDGQLKGTERRRGAFLARYSSDGSVRSANIFSGAEGYSRRGKMSVGLDGSVTLAGELVGTVTIGGATLMGRPMVEGQFVPFSSFVVALGADGSASWSRIIDSSSLELFDVASGASGVALVGQVRGSFTFAGRSMTSSASGDAVALLLSGDGASEKWMQVWGGVEPQYAAGEYATGVAQDATGDVFVTGIFQATTNFGSGPMVVPSGQRYGFFASRLSGGRSAVAGGILLPHDSDCEGCREGDAYLHTLAP